MSEEAVADRSFHTRGDFDSLIRSHRCFAAARSIILQSFTEASRVSLFGVLFLEWLHCLRFVCLQSNGGVGKARQDALSRHSNGCFAFPSAVRFLFELIRLAPCPGIGFDTKPFISDL